MIKNSSAAASSEPILVSEKSDAVISGPEAEKILEQLQQNEKLNKEILKSVKFIKHYFAWQSVMSVVKYSLLAAVIVLGVVSWRSIVDYASQAIGNSLVGVSVPGATIFK
jgi:hypothetical protein